MDDLAHENRNSSDDRRRLLGRLWHAVPLVLGTVAFELTANPLVGTAVACWKFGWEDFATALWCVRSDGDRGRGAACAGFHAALGFIKASVTGLGMVVMVVVLMQLVPGQPQALAWNGQIVAALLTISTSGAGFVVMLGLGIMAALLGRARVWVRPEVRRARKCREWPPRGDPPLPRNGNVATALLKGFCLLGGIGAGISILIVLGASGLLATPALALASLALCLTGSAALAALGFRWIGIRVIAATPLQCWPEPEGYVHDPRAIEEQPCPGECDWNAAS